MCFTINVSSSKGEVGKLEGNNTKNIIQLCVHYITCMKKNVLPQAVFEVRVCAGGPETLSTFAPTLDVCRSERLMVKTTVFY